MYSLNRGECAGVTWNSDRNIGSPGSDLIFNIDEALVVHRVTLLVDINTDPYRFDLPLPTTTQTPSCSFRLHVCSRTLKSLSTSFLHSLSLFEDSLDHIKLRIHSLPDNFEIYRLISASLLVNCKYSLSSLFL